MLAENLFKTLKFHRIFVIKAIYLIKPWKRRLNRARMFIFFLGSLLNYYFLEKFNSSLLKCYETRFIGIKR